MSTKKIADALERMEREAKKQREWGTVNLAAAALDELENLRRAARIWQEDLDADKRSAREPKAAFAAHQGTYPDLRELLRALGRLRWDNLHLLPLKCVCSFAKRVAELSKRFQCRMQCRSSRCCLREKDWEWIDVLYCHGGSP